MVSEIRFFKKMKKKKMAICENCVYLYFTPPSSIFLHVVTFSHVLHLDVLRRQIELKLNAKIEISLCMAIMQNHPLPSQYYRTVGRPTDRIPKCLYALLFHRHLSTFRGTQYGPNALTGQGKPKEERERRATESDETREARLRRSLERASCF